MRRCPNPSTRRWQALDQAAALAKLSSIAITRSSAEWRTLPPGQRPRTVARSRLPPWRCALTLGAGENELFHRRFAPGVSGKNRQPRPKSFLKLESTAPAGMNRRNLLNNEARPLGGRRILQTPKAASMIVSATPSAPGALLKFL